MSQAISAPPSAMVAHDPLPIAEVEERRAKESYDELIARLSTMSVRKHFDAYADVPWDDPEFAIRRDDPRFELTDQNTLGETAWYQSLPQPTRAELGLETIVGSMKMGVVFENVLKRGLLNFAFHLPNGSPEFRYCYHETIEEAQHSLMFQEFINRSNMNPPGPSMRIARGTRFVARLGRVFPELFFFFVLGGEEPIDYAQKRTLRGDKKQHPLVERISKIHITEEARHLCFARNFLQRNVPRLGFIKRLRLRIMIPIILGQMAAMMLEPSRRTIAKYKIPKEVLREAYYENKDHKHRVRESLASVAKLAIDLGLLTTRDIWLWRFVGLGNPFRYAKA